MNTLSLYKSEVHKLYYHYMVYESTKHGNMEFGTTEWIIYDYITIIHIYIAWTDDNIVYQYYDDSSAIEFIF